MNRNVNTLKILWQNGYIDRVLDRIAGLPALKESLREQLGPDTVYAALVPTEHRPSTHEDTAYTKEELKPPLVHRCTVERRSH